MRDPNRIPRILHKVEILWRENPDWRLGQLLSNVTARANLFNVEDDNTEKGLDQYLVNAVHWGHQVTNNLDGTMTCDDDGDLFFDE